jgi:hypothetical protein
MENTESEAYKKFRAAEKSQVCAQCGANLTTIWDSDNKRYAVICAHDPKHEGYRRRPTETDLVKQGALDTLKGPGAQKDVETYLAKTPAASPLFAGKDVATGQGLSEAQVQGLITFASDVDLKAELGHVCLYFGKPYVTMDGYWYRKFQTHADFVVSCMPMTKEERKSYMVGEKDFAFIARALTTGGDELNRGIGILTDSEINEKSAKHPENFAAPVAHDKPQIMTEKRATWQLLRKMIPLGAEAVPDASRPRVPSPIAPMTDAEYEKLWPQGRRE